MSSSLGPLQSVSDDFRSSPVDMLGLFAVYYLSFKRVGSTPTLFEMFSPESIEKTEPNINNYLNSSSFPTFFNI